jgi:hypothetical protein
MARAYAGVAAAWGGVITGLNAHNNRASEHLRRFTLCEMLDRRKYIPMSKGLCYGLAWPITLPAVAYDTSRRTANRHFMDMSGRFQNGVAHAMRDLQLRGAVVLPNRIDRSRDAVIGQQTYEYETIVEMQHQIT